MEKRILERYHKNPILLPNESNWWESKAVFNCGILHYEDKIHMLYRAVGEYEKYISRIGHASSTDGFCFNREKEATAALVPVEEYEKYGIEDPRLVEIDHQVYLTYVVPSTYVHEGSLASTALATTTDFNEYTRLGIITTKGSDNKDVVIFPEKIVMQQQMVSSNMEKGAKYLFLHRPRTWVGPRYGVDRP